MIHRMILSLAVSTALASFALGSTSFAADTPQDRASDVWADTTKTVETVVKSNFSGDIGVELYPEIAPKHVAQIKTLTRQGYYNDVPFHRVIKGFMNQTGDGEKGNGTGTSSLPNIKPEFKFRRGADMPFESLSKKKIVQIDSLSQQPSGEINIGLGFYKSLPLASQPTSQTQWTHDNKVEAFGLHCKGVTSMARTNDVNGANGQFFLMRAKYESLDQKYSIWGNTVMGFDLVEKPLVGNVSDDPSWIPDRMDVVRIAADMPDTERPKVQVLRTDHAAFKGWLETQKKANGTLPDICDLSVPTRKL